MDDLTPARPGSPPSLSVPEEWERLLARLEAGTILVVGAAGSGRGALARYLVGQLDRALPRVGLVDTGLGEPTVGVPGCLGLALTGPWEAPAALWFVGATEPVGHLLPTVAGTARLVEQARRQGARTVVIDGGDCPQGAEGRSLYLHQALLAEVEQVVAVERETELEGLLAVLSAPGRTIHRVPAAAGARPLPEEARASARRARWAAHFSGAGVRHFGRARLLSREWGAANGEDPPPGTLLGLLAEDGGCLALGSVAQVGRDRVAVLTPWKDPRAVHRLQVGHTQVDPEVLAEISEG
jgi:polynucleotide 5'-kinase involved in rRNA processing